MRVLLSIDSSSTVTCADPALPVRRLVAAADGAGGLVPLVDYGHHADEQAAGLMAQGAAAIYGLYERMMRRVISAGDPEAFGQYLADCLLGPNWAAIRAAAAARNEWFIELALSCDPQDVALSRLPWELMRGSADYISNGYVRDNRRVYVAITRVVPKAASTPRQIEGLPRV